MYKFYVIQNIDLAFWSEQDQKFRAYSWATQYVSAEVAEKQLPAAVKHRDCYLVTMYSSIFSKTT